MLFVFAGLGKGCVDACVCREDPSPQKQEQAVCFRIFSQVQDQLVFLYKSLEFSQREISNILKIVRAYFGEQVISVSG